MKNQNIYIVSIIIIIIHRIGINLKKNFQFQKK